ncbi:MAG TPA: 3'-5' exonuclease [Chitinophagaceae bacterium]|nr:3'-5' exonuclease [Chitinophagaceae bacterium]
MSPVPVNQILFLDIETVPQYAAYDQLPPAWKELWDLKAAYLVRNRQDETPESVYSRAAIYAEFGQIVCISCGVLSGHGPHKKLLIKSFFGSDEKQLLLEFADMLANWTGDTSKYLCAHNGKEFDFPYLCRRMVVQQVPIPALLQLAGKKPWEINHLDTMELWKFGDFKTYTSLNLLAHTLGIPTPKDDIDGSRVAEVYWKDQDLDRIVTYCQKDVITAAQVYLRLSGETLVAEPNIAIK